MAACLLLAACSGSSTVATGPAAGTTAAASLSRFSTAPPPTAAPATTPAAPPRPVSSAEALITRAPTSMTTPAGSAVTAGGTACSLVTEHDATVALGSDPGAGQPVTSHGATQCQYGSFQTSLVLVNVTPSQGGAAYDRMRHNPQLATAGTAVDVPGVGDRAFGIAGHGQASIWINQSDALVLVMVMVMDRSSALPPQASVLALAKTVSGRL